MSTQIIPVAHASVQATMTSLEIAELLGNRHDNVKRTIERLAHADVISLTPLEEVRVQRGRREETTSVYYVGKRDSYVVVAQLSPQFTGLLVDRWQELEAAASTPAYTLPDFTNPAVAAIAWAEQYQAKELAEAMVQEQAKLIEQQRPDVEFVDRYVDVKSTKGVREVSKILGMKEREFTDWLHKTGVLSKQTGHWLPKATYQHAGYFEVKTGEANGQAYTQTRFTTAGIEWVARRLGKTTPEPVVQVEPAAELPSPRATLAGICRLRIPRSSKA